MLTAAVVRGKDAISECEEEKSQALPHFLGGVHLAPSCPETPCSKHHHNVISSESASLRNRESSSVDSGDHLVAAGRMLPVPSAIL